MDEPATVEAAAPGAATGQGVALAVIAILGILIAGVFWPIVDNNEPKMQCYWAMRGAMAVYLCLGACGIMAYLSTSADALRTACSIAVVCGLVLIVLLHALIPVMENNLPHAFVQDAIALVAMAVAATGLQAAKPPVDIEQALDAAEATAGGAEADVDEAPDAVEAADSEPES